LGGALGDQLVKFAVLAYVRRLLARRLAIAACHAERLAVRRSSSSASRTPGVRRMAQPVSKASPDDLSSLELVKTKSADLTQAAARMGVSYNYLRERAKDGRIPTFVVGTQIRIWLVDLGLAA